jgi:hypothetical protein
MHRFTGAALGVLASLVPAAAAQAGTVTLDKPCYVEDDVMVATGTGFKPNSSLTLSGDGAYATAVADAAGNFQVPVTAPINPSIDAKPASVVSYALNVEDFSDAAQNTTVSYQVANFTVDRGRTPNPKAKRTWYFSGFPSGSTIYGHFRYKRRTVTNYRFGKAAGPCGLLKVRARGIPVRRVRTGTWTVQIDTQSHFNKDARPSLKAQISVFLVPR